MPVAISPAQFYDSEGLEDWRVVLPLGACGYFRTRSFAKGVALVDQIGLLADAAIITPMSIFATAA